MKQINQNQDTRNAPRTNIQGTRDAPTLFAKHTIHILADLMPFVQDAEAKVAVQLWPISDASTSEEG